MSNYKYYSYCSMSPNIPGNWRFAVAQKGFAKQRPATAKCGGEKPHKGHKPDCGFAEPEPPYGRWAVTVCYVLVLLL